MEHEILEQNEISPKENEIYQYEIKIQTFEESQNEPFNSYNPDDFELKFTKPITHLVFIREPIPSSHIRDWKCYSNYTLSDPSKK